MSGTGLTLQTLLAIVAMIASAVTGNVLMKIGAARETTAWMLGLASWQTSFGVFFFALSVPCYVLILKALPLSVAQCLMAAQFVGVILASALLLSEHITVMRWSGIALIAIGIVVVALSVGAGET
jgi:multidrug transporter EmrE-like cation transporter